MKDSDFQLFCQNRLFSSLAPQQLEALYSISKKSFVQKDHILIHEGEKAEELFIILNGTLEITKYDSEEKATYVIDTLLSGDTVGEISFIDNGFRSASVRAKTDTEVRSIHFKDLEEIVKRSPELSAIYLHLSKNISQRLRTTNNVALEAMKKEVKETKTRVTMGLFLVNIITILCLFAYALNGLEYLLRIAPNTTYVTLPLTIILGIILLIMMSISKLSWKQFGLHFKDWKKAAGQGILYSLPFIGIGIIGKWLFIQFIPLYAGHKIFEPFATILEPEHQNWGYWLFLNFIYWAFMAPLQELMTRGALQGLLEQFLTGRFRIFLSILMSNLIFSTVHIFFSIHIGLIVLLGGLYLGWIYSRTHNLITSWTTHAIAGTWLLSVIGPALAK